MTPIRKNGQQFTRNEMARIVKAMCSVLTVIALVCRRSLGTVRTWERKLS